MVLLRKLAAAGLVALVTAEESRQLGFSTSDFKEELSKKAQELPKLDLHHAFTSDSDVSVDSSGTGLNPMSILSGATDEAKAQLASNADTSSRSSTLDGSNPFSNNVFDGFGAPSTTAPPASSNAGLGGPDLTAKTGSDIMQGMIRSFLANKKLELGEEQCLEQGCGAIGSSAASVSSNVAVLANQVIASQAKAAGPASESLREQDASLVTQADTTIARAPTPAPSFWNHDVATSSAAPQSQATAFSLFGASQGRRLESVEPMMMLGMAGYGMSLGKEVQNLASLGHEVMSKCLQSDGKNTFETAANNAKDPAYLTKSLSANGVDAFGDLTGALQSWESGDATGFGNSMGSALREVFLDKSDGTSSLSQGLPDKATMGNVTAAMMTGFFGGGTATVKTPEATWDVNLNDCVGKNIPLLQYMASNIFKLPGTQSSSSAATPSAASSDFSSGSAGTSAGSQAMMYAALQLPAAAKQCGIGTEQQTALKDALASSTLPKLDVDLPTASSMSKTQAASEAADTASSCVNLVSDPTTAGDCGKSLGANLQKLLTSMSNKYYVDTDGHLRHRLTGLDLSIKPAAGGAASMIAPLLMAGSFLLIGFALIAIKRRHPTSQDQNFLDLEDASEGEHPAVE
mmetsp:Transcript_53562/g.96102  ORF Transcript_53562/g.96102 Transcript_53562/m.96102 type:complete len:631 (+) Transcript_53562:88-1980(+)